MWALRHSLCSCTSLRAVMNTNCAWYEHKLCLCSMALNYNNTCFQKQLLHLRLQRWWLEPATQCQLNAQTTLFHRCYTLVPYKNLGRLSILSQTWTEKIAARLQYRRLENQKCELIQRRPAHARAWTATYTAALHYMLFPNTALAVSTAPFASQCSKIVYVEYDQPF